MNIYEIAFFCLAEVVLYAYLRWVFRSWRTALLLSVVSSIPIFLSVERGSQFLTTDAARIVTETLSLDTSRMHEWKLGAFRTSDALLGPLAIGMRTFIPTMTEVQGKMMLKNLHWLSGFIVILWTHFVAHKHLITQSRQKLFIVLFLYTALLFPVNNLGLKVFNYDALSLFFGVLASLYLVVALQKQEPTYARNGIITGMLAAQEKLIASPVLIVAIATYAAMWVLKHASKAPPVPPNPSHDHKGVTSAADAPPSTPNPSHDHKGVTSATDAPPVPPACRGEMSDSPPVYGGARGGEKPQRKHTIFSSLLVLYVRVVVGIGLAFGTGLASAVIVAFIRQGNLPERFWIDVAYPILSWTWVILLFVFKYTAQNLWSTNTIFTSVGIAIVAISALTLALIAATWVIHKYPTLTHRVQRAIHPISIALIVLALIGGVIGTYVIDCYWGPHYLPHNPDSRMPGIFNGVFWHFDAPTYWQHRLSFIGYAYAAFINAIPTVFWVVFFGAWFAARRVCGATPPSPPVHGGKLDIPQKQNPSHDRKGVTTSSDAPPSPPHGGESGVGQASSLSITLAAPPSPPVHGGELGISPLRAGGTGGACVPSGRDSEKPTLERGANGGAAHTLLNLALIAVLLVPLAMALIQMPIASRYMNLFLFLFIVVIIIHTDHLLVKLPQKYHLALVASFAVLLLAEVLPFRPLYAPFRPIWSEPKGATMPTEGTVSLPWFGWGEEEMLAGHLLEEQCRRSGDNTLDGIPCDTITLHVSYAGGWLTETNTITIGKKVATPVNIPLTKADYLVTNRSSVMQGYLFLSEIPPMYTIAFRGYAQAWIFRGDQFVDIPEPTTARGYYERGRFYLEQQPSDPQRAIADFTQALALDLPMNTTLKVYEKRAKVYGAQGKYALALADLGEMIALYPVPENYLERGTVYLQQGNDAEAEADFAQYVELSTDKARAYYRRGIAYRQNDMLDEAIADFDQAIAISPRNAQYYLQRGATYRDMDKFAEALADFDRTLVLSPANSAAYYQRGVTYQQQKEFDKALAELNQALTIDSSLAIAYYRRGMVYYQQGEVAQAIADLNQAIALDATNTGAYYYRGIAYQQQKELDKALADFDELLHLDPDHAQGLYRRGMVYRQQGEVVKAIADFTKAIALAPTTTGAYYYRGIAYQQQKELDKALADFDELLHLDPDDAQGLYRRGIIYHQQGERTKAIADLSQAIALAPNTTGAYYYRGIAYQQQKELDKALADFDELLHLDPDHAQGLYRRGIIYHQQGERTKAIADLSQAIALAPNTTGAYYQRGIAYQQQKELDKALADFDELLHLDPDHAQGLYRRGMVYRQQGEVVKAIADFTKAIELNPKNDGFYLQRGIAYRQHNEPNKAIADFNKVLELSTNEQQRQRAEEELEKVTGE